uniref:3-hydroxyacyl-CoA dehydrogenase, NAD-binding n=1 Tax=Sphingomonas sp. JE1 TaxID=1628059 RepID=A0A0D5A002_9SPHN|nr:MULTISPECIES: 3-hydroxyacyl-CoA dehydrogenase family protein [unclassified Sphingomonas]AJW29585.1 3-hydroxyacyl-CoA dehydrogenase, NAD-binding [Sphingomonas sp. JE1]
MASHSYSIEFFGESRSFPDEHDFVEKAVSSGDISVLAGRCPVGASQLNEHRRLAVLVELDQDCLGGLADESAGHSNVIGFARWRLGDNAPTDLVELVTQPGTRPESIAAARDIFEESGLAVAQCKDRIGRIVDRLIRPQFNLALNAVDDGLATADDLEMALKLGLGYRRGLLRMVQESGLAQHHHVTEALFKAYGHAKYSPPRSSIVASRVQALARTVAEGGEK